VALRSEGGLPTAGLRRGDICSSVHAARKSYRKNLHAAFSRPTADVCAAYCRRPHPPNAAPSGRFPWSSLNSQIAPPNWQSERSSEHRLAPTSASARGRRSAPALGPPGTQRKHPTAASAARGPRAARPPCPKDTRAPWRNLVLTHVHNGYTFTDPCCTRATRPYQRHPPGTPAQAPGAGCSPFAGTWRWWLATQSQNR
jgi:hypothetical protein